MTIEHTERWGGPGEDCQHCLAGSSERVLRPLGADFKCFVWFSDFNLFSDLLQASVIY
jgi:hypothetical protein